MPKWHRPAGVSSAACRVGPFAPSSSNPRGFFVGVGSADVVLPETTPVRPTSPGLPQRRPRLSDELAFLVTNRIPRRWATMFMGWFSRLETPLVAQPALALWRALSRELDLSECERTEFRSVHDCFVRALRPGARPIDPDPAVLTSPCDAIVGACGRLDGTRAIQAKGLDYELVDLLGDHALVDAHRGGSYVTLRIKATMYHRFHAPCDARLSEVVYISGDTWNVNPVTVARVRDLFCRNERAVLDLHTGVPDERVTLVPVAAILVAGIRVHGLPDVLDLRYRGPNRLAVDRSFTKGDELGWFQHGSTILAFASGALDVADDVEPGRTIRVGQPLFRRRHSPIS